MTIDMNTGMDGTCLSDRHSKGLMPLVLAMQRQFSDISVRSQSHSTPNAIMDCFQMPNFLDEPCHSTALLVWCPFSTKLDQLESDPPTLHSKKKNTYSQLAAFHWFCSSSSRRTRDTKLAAFHCFLIDNCKSGLFRGYYIVKIEILLFFLSKIEILLNGRHGTDRHLMALIWWPDRPIPTAIGKADS